MLHVEPHMCGFYPVKCNTFVEYSAKLDYSAQFVGHIQAFSPSECWNVDDIPKAKLFSWLVLHGKILMAENLVIHGWPHSQACHISPCG